jgi:hypothetical protein
MVQCTYMYVYMYVYIYIKVCRGSSYIVSVILTFVLAAGQCSSSDTATLILPGRPPDNHLKRGWLGSRTGKLLERGKISCPLPDPITDTSPHIFCRLCNNGSTDTHVRQNYVFRESYAVWYLRCY